MKSQFFLFRTLNCSTSYFDYYVTHPRGDRGARYGEGLGRVYVKTGCGRKRAPWS